MLSFSKKVLLALTLLLSAGVPGVVKAMYSGGYGQYGQPQYEWVYLQGSQQGWEFSLTNKIAPSGNYVKTECDFRPGQEVFWNENGNQYKSCKLNDGRVVTYQYQQVQQPVYQPVQQQGQGLFYSGPLEQPVQQGFYQQQPQEQFVPEIDLKYIWDPEKEQKKPVKQGFFKKQEPQFGQPTNQFSQGLPLKDEEKEVNPFFKVPQKPMPTIEKPSLPSGTPLQPNTPTYRYPKGAKFFAGVLPYVIAIENGQRKIYFLQSEEADKNKNYNLAWGDFGGSGDKGESFEKAAAREGYEEMSKVLKEEYLLNKIMDAKANNREMKGAEDAANFVIDITDHFKGNADQISRDAFIAELNKASNSFKVQGHQFSKYCEKNNFRWIERAVLIKAIEDTANGKQTDLKVSGIRVYKSNIPLLEGI